MEILSHVDNDHESLGTGYVFATRGYQDSGKYVSIQSDCITPYIDAGYSCSRANLSLLDKV